MNKFAGSFARAAKGLTVAFVTAIALCMGVFASACSGHEHSLEKVDAVQPTCIAEGRAEYWKCSECDEIFSDADGKNPVTEEELVLAKVPHSYNLNVTIEERNRYAGDYISQDELSFLLKCPVCGDEQVAEEVTADLDKALVEGANNFVVTSGEYTTVLTVVAQADGKRPSSLAVALADPDAVFHVGQTVKSSDFTVTYKVEGKPDQTVTDFKITNPAVGAETKEIEVSYNGKTASAGITVHAVTHHDKVDSTVDTEGTVEYYSCEVCKKNFDTNFNEIDDITIPVKNATLKVTTSKVFHSGQTVKPSDLTVTYQVEGGTAEKVTDFAITNPEVDADTTEIEVSYKGKTAATEVEVHNVTWHERQESTADKPGQVEHYSCDVCNKYFDAEFNEIEDITMPVKGAELIVTTDKIFHTGQTVKASDFTVTYKVEGEEGENVTGFNIVNPIISEDTEEIRVTYNGLTATTKITVHSVTHHDRVDSTVEESGIIEHYSCSECGKYFDTDMNEIEDIVLPEMQPISITDGKITITNSDGKTVALKKENGYTFLGGDPSGYYGRIFIKFNVSVEKDTDILFYLRTSSRIEQNKISDVYSVKINGVEIKSGDGLLPYGDAADWFADDYSFVGAGRLIAGQNNVIEVTRINLISKDYGGDKTYNFFGMGITPFVSTEVVLNEPCTHICPHCGKCTDAESASPVCAEKCPGHEGEHFCESICPICGECTDEGCVETACANKCDGCTEFTVMDDSVTVVNKDGGTVNKNTASNEQNISANDSNVKKGYYKVTYNIHSDKDITVKLYIKTCAQMIQNSLDESYKFTVNGTPVEVDGSIMMPWNEANRWKDIRYTCVGEIQLKAGDNAIVIERPDMADREYNDYTGYNFFGIALSGDATLTFVK